MNFSQKSTREAKKKKARNKEVFRYGIELVKYISFLIFSIGTFILGIGSFLQYANETSLFPKIKNWESIPCKIKELTIHAGTEERHLYANVMGRIRGPRTPFHWIDVLYEYQWKEKKYTSSRLTVRNKKKYYDQDAEKIYILKNNILEKQFCKINPENPEEAILFPGIPPDKTRIFTGFVFSSLGAILLFFSSKILFVFIRTKKMPKAKIKLTTKA